MHLPEGSVAQPTFSQKPKVFLRAKAKKARFALPSVLQSFPTSLCAGRLLFAVGLRYAPEVQAFGRREKRRD
jgi:hypothetical protein